MFLSVHYQFTCQTQLAVNKVKFSEVADIYCVFCSLLLIAYTPLINYVPGKSSVETQKNLIELSLRSDSLQKILLNRSVYLENINNIILGKELVGFGEVKNKEMLKLM